MKLFGIISAAILLGALVCSAQEDAAKTYADKCATCHGPDGSAKTAKAKQLKVRSAKDSTAKLSAADMIKIVDNGKGVDMPPYGKQLSKEQIQAVVEHFRGLGK